MCKHDPGIARIYGTIGHISLLFGIVVCQNILCRVSAYSIQFRNRCLKIIAIQRQLSVSIRLADFRLYLDIREVFNRCGRALIISPDCDIGHIVFVDKFHSADFVRSLAPMDVFQFHQIGVAALRVLDKRGIYTVNPNSYQLVACLILAVNFICIDQRRICTLVSVKRLRIGIDRTAMPHPAIDGD